MLKKDSKNKFFLPLLSIFIFLFLISLVSAEPPFQQVSGDLEGLDLRFPPVETVKTGRNVTSHMHVYNHTDGLLLTNTTVDCFVHLYNSVGDHLVEQEMGFDDNSVDFELKILGGNFTTSERQSFIIWCNSSTAGGFVSGGFDVTPTGKTGVSTFIFIFLIIITLTFALGVKLQNNWVMMLGSILVLFFGFFIIIYGIDIFKDTTTTWAVGLIVWALAIVGIYLSIEGQLAEGRWS